MMRACTKSGKGIERPSVAAVLRLMTNSSVRDCSTATPSTLAAARLTTAGFGETRPKDRNDTLDGRARNRRVELVRER